MSLEEAAKRYRSSHSGEAKDITRNGIVSGLGREPKLVGTLFALPVKAWTPVLASESSVLFAFIDAHRTPSEEEFQKQAGTIRQSVLNERRQVAFVEWMQAVRRRAKIIDYRENFFEA